MRSAAHAFAVGVEHQRGDVGQPVGGHRLGEAALQAFDGEGGGHLPDEAPGVREPGLHCHAASQAGIGAVGRLCQQGVEEPAAVLKSGLGLEQRRDIDLVLDPEQLGEIERGEHRGRLFALGHQHADRRVCIDMLEDLRHREELADRSRAFGGEGGEIGAQRAGFIHHPAQRRNRALAGQIDRLVIGKAAADGVVELLGVHPEVNPAHAEAISAHRSGEGEQADGAGGIGCLGLGFQRSD